MQPLDDFPNRQVRRKRRMAVRVGSHFVAEPLLSFHVTVTAETDLPLEMHHHELKDASSGSGRRLQSKRKR